jgi:uncharacterized protein YjbI with pentapeptide repeats
MRSPRSPRARLALLLAAAGAAAACESYTFAPPDASTPAVDVGTAPPARLLHEHQFDDDPSLRATTADLVVVQLEHPESPTVSAHDTGDPGTDVIPYQVYGRQAIGLCMLDSELSNHQLTFHDSSGAELARVQPGGDCVVAPLQPGAHELRLAHDGAGDANAPATIFLQPTPMGSPQWCQVLGHLPENESLCGVETYDLSSADWTWNGATIGALKAGSVAVFEKCQYQGRAWVLEPDGADYLGRLDDYGFEIGSPFSLDKAISSVKLGPGTFLWGYERADFGGVVNQFYRDEPCLAGNQSYKPATGKRDFDDAISSAALVASHFVFATVNSCVGCNLRGLNHPGGMMQGVDLSEAALDWAVLRGTTLMSVKLAGASLRNVDASRNLDGSPTIIWDSHLEGADLDGATLQGAATGFSYFDQASFHDTDLTGVTIGCTSFAGADLTGARFDSTPTVQRANSTCRTSFAGATVPWSMLPPSEWSLLDLSRVSFTGVPAAYDWSGKHLDGARMAGVDLHAGKFYRTTFTGADMTQVDLHGAVLGYASLDQAVLSGASLAYVDASNATFAQAALQATATLPGAVLSYAYLASCSFDHTDLAGANLSYATLHGTGATLAGANLTLANLTRADLSSMDLSSVTAQGAKLDGAILARARLAGTDFGPYTATGSNQVASLVDAVLCGATLDGTVLYGADLTNAYFGMDGGKVLPLPNGGSLTCGAASFANVKTDDTTTCPDGSHGPCAGSQWSPGVTPPTPCCVSDGVYVCPARKRPGFPCTARCDCISQHCTDGKCE